MSGSASRFRSLPSAPLLYKCLPHGHQCILMGLNSPRLRVAGKGAAYRDGNGKGISS